MHRLETCAAGRTTKALSTGYALSKVPLRPPGVQDVRGTSALHRPKRSGDLSVLTDGGRLFAALIPPLSGFLPTAQHCNVYNFCNLAIFKSAIPRLQNSNTLHCCAVTLPVRHCLILSSSQYHVLFIRFARKPNSLFAFSSVRFDMLCSSARLKISLLCMALFVSASSLSRHFACSILFPRATSQSDMLAYPFGDCREGQIYFDRLSGQCRLTLHLR